MDITVKSLKRMFEEIVFVVDVDAGEEEVTAVPDSQENIGFLEPVISGNGKRRLQNVTTKMNRKRVMLWMDAEVERCNNTKDICAKAVKEFPSIFRTHGHDNHVYKANIQKASRWWKAKETFLQKVGKTGRTTGNVVTISANQKKTSRKIVRTKALKGRGRKREPWVEWLHQELLSKFERLKKASVKLSPALLLVITKQLLLNSENPELNALAKASDGKELLSKLNPRWIQSFQEQFDITQRKQTGKLATSPAHQEFMERTVAYHIGIVQRQFQAGELNEDMVENIDETHFVFNMDNGKTLGFLGDTEVKYANVVSGGEGMTLVVRLSGGRDSCIQTPMLIFTNALQSHPIQGVPDDVPDVCYRSGPRGWNDTIVFPQYLTESRIMRRDHYGRRRVLFVDNCSGHNHSKQLQAALTNLNAEIRYLPANSTHITQPCDSFVIQKIKQEWRNRWEAYKLEEINKDAWTSSGMIRNPGKHFFLKIAADSMRTVNSFRDKNGISYARKAMIRCGLALNLNGRWDIDQLSPELQNVIRKYPEHFRGEPVPTE
ncbi:unnamed protein product [Calypogeia fissa]